MKTMSAAHETHDAERHLPRAVLDNRGRRWTALLDRIAAGDTEALGSLYDESSSLAFGLIMHILQDREAAEDALVAVYRQVWEQARSNVQARNPVSWLMGLARRAALARRGGRRHFSYPVQLPSLPPAPATSVTRFEPFHRERQRISRALDQLTPQQRSIVQMTYFGGFSGREVAEELKIARQEVMSEIRRAMWALRSALRCVDPD
jgi:RNA polymerase sigma-70 factor, ECF subfamily